MKKCLFFESPKERPGHPEKGDRAQSFTSLRARCLAVDYDASQAPSVHERTSQDAKQALL